MSSQSQVELKELPPAYEKSIYPATPSVKFDVNGTPLAAVSAASWKKPFFVALVVLLGVTTVTIIVAAVVVTSGSDEKTTTPSSGATTTAGTTTSTFPPTTPSSGWGEWSQWSECDQSCDLGTKTRTRECYSDPVDAPQECIGSDSQVVNCYEQQCPTPVYGTWTQWNAWTECSTTCGGGSKSRVRTCEKDDPDENDCVGRDSEARDCSVFDCPTCDRTCPGGGSAVPPDCDRCICTGQTLTGRVIGSTSNLPVEGAAIADSVLPSVILATSDVTGAFTITDFCLYTTLLVTVEGFAETDYLVTSLNDEKIPVLKIEMLQVSLEPSDKMRLVGESVTMCCQVSGTPPPDVYEWYLNGNVIDDTKYSTNTLIIDSVKLEDSGQYQCKAYNDYGAVFSEEAELKVKDTSNEFCDNSGPSQSMIQLPPGCTYDSSNLYNVGKCNRNPCRGSNTTDNGECNENSLYCCGGIEYDTETIQCNGYTMQMSTITKCGCVQCVEPYILVKGNAYNGITKEPIPNVAVLVNGSEVARADGNGLFSINVPLGTRKMVLKVEDIYKEHLFVVKPLYFRKGQTGSMFVNIKMLSKGPKQTGLSNEDNIFNIGSNLDKPYSQIFIQKNTVHTIDGESYSGEFDVVVNAIDPQNVSDFENIPADLTYRDDEGNTQRLETFGMYALSLEDPSGQQLQVKGKIQIALDSSLFSPEKMTTEIKLWSLDSKTGTWTGAVKMTAENDTFPAWRKNSRLRDFSKLKSVIVGDKELDVTNPWSNFDGDNEHACHSKIRAFKTNEYKEDEQLPGVTALYVMTYGEGDIVESADIRSYSDEGDSNGYCWIHTCKTSQNNRDYRGAIIAYPPNKGDPEDRLKPATYIDLYTKLSWSENFAEDLEYEYEDKENFGAFANFDLERAKLEGGPFYDTTGEGGKKWTQSGPCSTADITQPYFAFYDYDPDFSPNCPPDAIPIDKVEPENLPEDNLKAWFAKSVEGKYQVCDVRVHVTGFVGTVQAVSMVSNFTYGGIRPGEAAYGTSFHCTTETSENKLCMEVKRGGEVTTGESTPTIFYDDTQVVISPILGDGSPDPACTVSEINPCLLQTYPNAVISKAGGSTFEVYITGDVVPFGRDFGILCEDDKGHQDEARDSATEQCTADSQKNHADKYKNKSGYDVCLEDNPWAVKFDCN